MKSTSPASAEAAPHTAAIRVLVIPDNDNDPVRVEDVIPTDTWIGSTLGIWTPQPIYGPTWTAWCDDYGMMRQLPVNFRAGRLLNYIGDFSGLMFGGLGPVLGPVALTGGGLEDDDALDVPNDVISAVTLLGWLKP